MAALPTKAAAARAGLLYALVSCLAALGLSGCDEDLPATNGVEFIDMRVEEISDVRAVVRFDTSVPTSCELEWGLSALALTDTATDPDMAEGETAIDHEVSLEDLQADTEYYFVAVATDEAGVTYMSTLVSFRTQPAGGGGGLGTNVALGATIHDVSSNFGGGDHDNTWGAASAIDGMMATEWSSAGDGDAAFVDIDLAEDQQLSAVGFRSRKMLDGSSIITSFRLTLEGAAGAAAPVVLGPFSTPDPDERYEFTFEPVAARRVRVDAVTTTGGNTGIKEVELFSR